MAEDPAPVFRRISGETGDGDAGGIEETIQTSHLS
jgi:hypothetical protein